MAGSVYPISQPIPFGLSPYGPFTVTASPFTSPQQSGQPLQQILQVLQIVPQQLQQLQQQQHVQQQHLQYVLQLLQAVPGQLAQLQQLIQFVPQQIQQIQQTQQQSFGQSPGLSGFAAATPWGVAPQIFAQPGQVM